MVAYYNVYVPNINQGNLERVTNILSGESKVSKSIIKIQHIYADVFYELEQLFPFECAKDSTYDPCERNTFLDNEKEELTNFFSDCYYIICNDNFSDESVIYSKDEEHPNFFETCDIRFWEEALDENKETILELLELANVDLDELRELLNNWITNKQTNLKS